MAERNAERGAYPVGVHAPAHVLQLVGVGFVHRAVLRGVKSGQPLQLEFLRGVAEVHRTEVGDAQFGDEVVAQAGLAVGHLLALDDDHAVGGAVAIDDGRLGVLQHVDPFDLVHVEVVELLHGDLRAVEDDERVVVGLLLGRRGDGVRTAYEDFRNGVGVRAEGVVVHDHHAGRHGAERRHDVGVRDRNEVFTLDRRHRAGVGVLVAGEHAVHHDVLDLCAALLERDLQSLGRTGHGDPAALHAEEADFEHGRTGLRREGDREASVAVGGDALSVAALQDDRRTGQRILVRVVNGSRDGELAGLARGVVDDDEVVLGLVLEVRAFEAFSEQLIDADVLEVAGHGGQLPDVFGIVGEADALLAGDFVQYGGHGRPFGVDRQRGVHVHGFTPPLRLRRKDRAAQQGHE